MPDAAVKTVAIVGAGIAGATAALTLRQEGYDGRIVLIGDEPEHPYRRPPLSKEVLRGAMPPARTRLKPPTTWADQSIELLTGTTVTALDARTLRLSDGSTLAFDRLLLATGGRPRKLPLASDLDSVHVLRTLADLAPLRQDLEPGSSLLVIGAGLVGLEVAATAREMGCEVTVLEAGDRPLARIAPAPIGHAVTELHRAHGVTIHTGVTLTSITADGQLLVAQDGQGRRWAARTVLVAIGMVPRTALAEQAGLDVRDGIVVDAYGTTSAPHMYAAGDVARHPDPLLGAHHRTEQWNHAQAHGAAVAANLLGAHRPFTTTPTGWTTQYGHNLQFCGHPTVGDHLTIDGDLTALDFTATAHRNGTPIGTITANRPTAFRAARELLDRAQAGSAVS